MSRARLAARLGPLVRADPAEPGVPRTEVLDIRGLWAVCGAWAAAAGLVHVEPLIAAGAAVAAAAATAWLAWALLGNRGLLAWAHHWWSPFAAALAGAALVSTAVAVHGVQTRSPGLDAHLSAGASLRFTAVATGTASLLASAPGRFDDADAGSSEAGGQWMVPATLERYRSGDAWHPARNEVMLLLSSDQFGAAAPRAGARISGIGRAGPARPGDRHDYWIRASAPVDVDGAVASGPVEHLRGRFSGHAAALPGDGPALLPGMVMGERSGQDEQLTQDMKDSGLVHLTAVSGANCAMILGAVLWLARALRLGRTGALVGALAALAGFVLLVHPEPSVVRAAVMGSIAAVAVYLGRGRQAFASLCVCIVALLAWNPWYAGQPAFQLSVLATSGIVVLGRPLALIMTRFLPRWLAEGIAISLAAQVFCLPVLVGLSGEVSVYAVLANVAAAPLVPVVTVVGTAGLLLAALPPWATWPMIWCAGLPAAAVGGIGRAVAGWPGATIPWPSGTAGVATAVLLCVLLVAASWAATSSARRERLAAGVRSPSRSPWLIALDRHAPLLLACAATALLAGLALPATALLRPDPGPWILAACDVGQGDGIVVATGPESAIVIDAGEVPEAVGGCLDRLGVQRVDAVFLTHLHADHAGGVGGVFMGGRSVGPVYYSSADADARPQGLPAGTETTRIAEGAHGRLGTVGWTVLSPPAAGAAAENDASLVMRLDLAVPGGTASVLATGDIEARAMSALLARHPGLDADILKVSHHGARNGGAEVIEQLRPSIALISVGVGNSYGHPAPQTLEALEAAEALTGRTDHDGTVLVSPAGDGVLELRSWGPPDAPAPRRGRG
ncbi:ComEC/Rec2 family competence protein [Zafaria sp. Z1313]|uniref:ComEC/Rec2 family competence protein n=1 Tax=Zafaria sp. Z1313 TaxID=3423202 RepID=UPI003D302F52